ncbi:MAG: hypothetical protein Q9217_000535 [Psora testacea]
MSRPVQDETPIGALILHWSFSTLLILATGAQTSPYASYQILVSLYSYTIDAIFGLCLGAGLLFLRLASGRKWAQKSRAGSGFSPSISIVAAALFTITNAFPIIAAWIPPSGRFQALAGTYFPWYSTPTVGWSVIVLGVVYWLVFRYVVPHIGDHRGKKLKVQRKLFFHEEHHYPVQWHEQIKFEWVTSRSSGNDFEWADEEIDVRIRG